MLEDAVSCLQLASLSEQPLRTAQATTGAARCRRASTLATSMRNLRRSAAA